MCRRCLLLVIAMSQLAMSAGFVAAETTLTGSVTDAATNRPLPARLYIQSADGRWFFAKSASPQGTAVEYRKQRSQTTVEMHTTLSAHLFTADLPPGQYTITVERGKEYLPVTKDVKVGGDPVTLPIKLRRWIDMARRGWYSGDTHVHRTIDELPNVMLAEDLNVALPLTSWVTTAYTAPSQGNKNTDAGRLNRLIRVDPTHVIYPRNTEYEIFSVGGKRHTLGAVFILNHKQPLTLGAPPVGPIAAEAHRQGAILDLDKHSWPWSLMLVPVMNVDLFELTNNHVWRTEFFFRRWTLDAKPRAMILADADAGWVEREWIDFGFDTYYTLLNCGFRMRPTAGTASGVHPVPLGFGRVYVQLKNGFNYDRWMQGLNAGHSFVTTGPMLFVEYNGKPPGHHFAVVDAACVPNCRVTGSAEAAVPLARIEILVNGEVVKTIKPENKQTNTGGFRSEIDSTAKIDGTSWVAVRCFEKRADRRTRFAHSAPVHFDVPGHPLRPRRQRVEYLIRRMEEEIVRNTGVLKPAELEEFRSALKIYRQIAAEAQSE